jgi:hypothetical protein
LLLMPQVQLDPSLIDALRAVASGDAPSAGREHAEGPGEGSDAAD